MSLSLSHQYPGYYYGVDELFKRHPDIVYMSIHTATYNRVGRHRGLQGSCTCTTVAGIGSQGAGATQLYGPYGVAIDASGVDSPAPEEVSYLF